MSVGDPIPVKLLANSVMPDAITDACRLRLTCRTFEAAAWSNALECATFHTSAPTVLQCSCNAAEF